MNKPKFRKIMFWSTVIGLAVLIVGDKGGGGYVKLIWAGCGMVFGAFVGALFSRK